MWQDSHLALQNCEVDILLPGLVSLGGSIAGDVDELSVVTDHPSHTTPHAGGSALSQTDAAEIDRAVLQAYESSTRDVSDVYVGESILVIVTVRSSDDELLRDVTKQYNTARVSTCVIAADQGAEEVESATLDAGTASIPNDTSVIAMSGSNSLAGNDDSTLVRNVSSHDEETVSSLGEKELPLSHVGSSLDHSGNDRPLLSPDYASNDARQQLPVLCESSWISVPGPTQTETSGSGTTAKVFTSKATMCKGLWVLIGSASCVSRKQLIPTLVEKQQLTVTLQKCDMSASMECLLVDQAIARARALSGIMSTSLLATKGISMRMPIEVTCECIPTEVNTESTLISISVSNVSGDVRVAVCEPCLQLESTRIISEDDRFAYAARTPLVSFHRQSTHVRSSFTGTPFVEKHFSALHSGSRMTLPVDSLFCVKRLDRPPDMSTASAHDGTNQRATSEDSAVRTVQGAWHEPAKPANVVISSEINHATFSACDGAREVSAEHSENRLSPSSGGNGRVEPTMPSVSSVEHEASCVGMPLSNTHTQRTSTVLLLPGEVYNFLFAIAPNNNLLAFLSDQLSQTSRLPTLEPGMLFETDPRVAWKCYPRNMSLSRNQEGDLRDTAQGISGSSLHRIFSQETCSFQFSPFLWRPADLVETVHITCSGLEKVGLGSEMIVDILVKNQTRQRLNQPKLYIQTDAISDLRVDDAQKGSQIDFPEGEGTRGRKKSHDESLLLLPLKPVIPLEPIDAGSSERVRIVCLAVCCGILSLGNVMLVDSLPSAGAVPHAWIAKNSFEVLVVGSETRQAGVQRSSARDALQDNRLKLITRDQKLVNLPA